MTGGLLLAHAGHWLSTLPFFAPVLALGAGVAAVAIRDRRRGVD